MFLYLNWTYVIPLLLYIILEFSSFILSIYFFYYSYILFIWNKKIIKTNHHLFIYLWFWDKPNIINLTAANIIFKHILDLIMVYTITLVFNEFSSCKTRRLPSKIFSNSIVFHVASRQTYCICLRHSVIGETTPQNGGIAGFRLAGTRSARSC